VFGIPIFIDVEYMEKKTMAKIITIPNDNDPVMNSERQRIVPWAPTHGWIYTGYNNEGDHIAQIRRAGGGAPLEVLDFDCHGNPTVFDHTYLSTAFQFGRTLSQSTGFSANTAIYLDACNTGLTSAYGGPIAQVVANGAGCRVYGTKGYMTGTYAEGNERCYASPDGLPPYPGAQDAVGRNVWIVFHPRAFRETEMVESRSITVGVDLTGRIWASFQPSAFRETEMNEPQSITIQANVRDATGLSAVLEEIIRNEPVEFPSWRMAPDITINYVRDEQVMILDVYANGGLLKERISGTTWRVQNATEFQALVRQNLL
jgi:hypothetical protein